MLFSPLQSKVRRLSRPHIRAPDVSLESWTIAPAEEVPCPAAIFDPDDLSRITGYAAHTHREQEMARLAPHVEFRRATTGNRLKNVVMCGGNLYAGAYKYPMRDSRKLLTHITQEIDDAGIPCSSWLGGLYFGHWLDEDAAVKLASQRFGRPTEIDFDQTPHQIAYNRLFGIERNIIPDDCLLREATLVDSDIVSSFQAEGWRVMSDRIATKFARPRHIGCMLLRGHSGSKRIMVNEAEIAARLQSIGFEIIDPATSTVDEILQKASGSRIVVGVEGSQLAHGFHCLDEGGAMLILQPPNRFGGLDKSRCDQKRIRYAFAVGHAVGDGFSVDGSALSALLDRLIAELRPASAAGL